MPKPSSIPLALVNAPTSGSKARRVFTAAYKLSIVEQADRCTEPGQLEALLRREGLYSSHLSKWRKQLRLRGSQGLAAARPGRKPTRDAKDARIAELEAKAARLEKKLLVANELLALQKNHPGQGPTCWTRSSVGLRAASGPGGAAGGFLATSNP